MLPHPTKLALAGEDRLRIEWSDGQQREYRFTELREKCPCATCREKRAEPPPLLPVLSPAEMQPVKVVEMQPVGNYAYAIGFSDGHSSGIYTLELLRELGERV